jgi:hypothetical protein
MQAKAPHIAHSWAVLLCFSAMLVGCSKSNPAGAPVAESRTPEQIKQLVDLLNAPPKTGPAYGADLKAIAAKELGDLGQTATAAGAIPALKKLSQNPKASPEAKAAAEAALAKLGADAAAK